MANVSLAIVHTYSLEKSTKTTQHYQLDNTRGGKACLTPQIRIARNRGYNKSKSIYLMTERDNPNKWNDRITTGLNRTKKSSVFEGDIVDDNRRKRDKVWFKFIDGDKLTITVIPNYFR